VVGAGITGAAAVATDGSAVYVATGGCGSFPSVGHANSVVALDPVDGSVDWSQRVDAPEEFGTCSESGGECGHDGACGGGSDLCEPKAAYRDWGFAQGPIAVRIDDGQSGTRPVLVAGNMNGTIYSFDAADGTIVDFNEVLAAPDPASGAGAGVFNGRLAYQGGRFYAALNRHPAADVAEHLRAFEADGLTEAWLADPDIGASLSSVLFADGLVFAGASGADELYTYASVDGGRLDTYPLPGVSQGRVAVDGGDAFVPFGVDSPGPTSGVRAYRALVPEPAAALLGLAAVCTLGLLARRRRTG
jgi:outer membrane protein assembly factor BamB